MGYKKGTKMNCVELLKLEKEFRELLPNVKYWKEDDHYVTSIKGTTIFENEHHYNCHNLEDFLKFQIEEAKKDLEDYDSNIDLYGNPIYVNEKIRRDDLDFYNEGDDDYTEDPEELGDIF